SLSIICSMAASCSNTPATRSSKCPSSRTSSERTADDDDFLVIAADSDDQSEDGCYGNNFAPGTDSDSSNWRQFLSHLKEQQAKEFAAAKEDCQRRLEAHTELAREAQRQLQAAKRAHEQESALWSSQLLSIRQRQPHQDREEPPLLARSAPSIELSASLGRSPPSPSLPSLAAPHSKLAIRNLRMQIDCLCQRLRQMEAQLADRDRRLVLAEAERDRLRRQVNELTNAG
ncbi:hypothetical protein BOX15_Mlig001625g1, partial [Macrostomum lignano]